MYKLEDRILFDGAAVADVTDAQQEAEAQQEAAQQATAAEAEEAAQQNSTEQSDGGDNSQTEASDSLTDVLAEIGAAGLGSDGQRIDVLLVSDSLENADDICNTADANTIVVRYDASTTSAADLMQQITDALGGHVADSIGFVTESGENAHVQLFADADTSLDTVNDTVHQDFFNSLDALLDDNGQVNLFASNLASTAEGEALVDAIGDSMTHDVAASTDETGSETAGGDWDLEYSTNGIEIDAADVYFDQNLVDNFDSLLEDHVSNEIVFINSSVMDVDSILDDLGDNVTVVMLDEGDAFQQITDYLQDKTDIDAIHIISHGNSGFFRLGNDTVDSEFAQEHQADFTTWGHALTARGDIMIYGCNIAESAEGQSLLQSISDFTGADVAASIDATGVKGDWELEYNVGDIETAALAVKDYSYSLANITVNNITDDPLGTLGDGVYTLRKAIAEAEAGDEIIFAAWVGTLDKTKPAGADVANYTIYLNASLGQMDISENITINGYIVLPDSQHTLVRVDARPLIETSTPGEFKPGTATTRVFFIKAVSDADNYVTMKNMIIQNGHAISTGDTIPSDGNGGGIYIDVNSKIVLNEVTVQNSEADISGGGIYNAGDLTIQSTTKDDVTAVRNNTAGNSGGGIFNGSTGSLSIFGGEDQTGTISVVRNVEIYENIATSGSGGGIYSVDDITLKSVTLEYNTASAGSGGAVAVENGSNDTLFHHVNMLYNRASVNGGGISYTQGKNLIMEWCFIQANTADNGDGGGIYFANNSGDLTIRTDNSYVVQVDPQSKIWDNYAGGNGGAVYVDHSGDVIVDFVRFYDNVASNNGGAFSVTNSGNITFTDVNISECAAGNNGGAIYYDSGTFTISTSCISNNGTATARSYAYLKDGDLYVYYHTETTTNGAGIYQEKGALNITNSTVSYNSALYNGGAIYLGQGSLSLTFATLAYNSASYGDGAHIYYAGAGASSLSVINTIIFNSSNPGETQIYVPTSDFTVGNFTYNIYSHWYNDYAVAPDHSLSLATVTGTGNITGVDATEAAYIENHLYLDTKLQYHANYRTMALAILYDNSIAYTRGISVSGITHDQRGNTRTGTDVNGNANAAPSIGAFEPIYYVTVTSKGDDSALRWSRDQNAEFFDFAKSSGDGLTLREAMYWLDTYDRSRAFDLGLYNANRWVKFDATVFASDTDNTISLTYGQIDVGYNVLGNENSKEIMVSSVAVADPTDPRNYGDINDPVAYVAQNAANRIIVDGNDNDGIFSIASGTIAYLNNLTITNGHETDVPGGGDAMGGGIRNYGKVVLNNFVVTNCIADNSLPVAGNYTDGGFGGGIYNGGTMHIYDSTITENSAVAYADDKHRPVRAGLGGGIYNAGNLTIERSTIYNNSVSGNIQYVTNESVVGAGIYNTITTNTWLEYISSTQEYVPHIEKVTGSGVLNIANSTISENTAYASATASDTNPAGSGSAIYMKDGDLALYYTTIVNNHADLNSGATILGSHAAVTTLGNVEYTYTYGGQTATYTSDLDFGLSNSILANNTVQVLSSPTVQEYLDLYINNTAAEPNNVNVINSTPIGDYNIIGRYNYDSTTGDGYDWNVRNNQIGDSFGYVVSLNIDSQLLYNGAKTLTYRLLDGSVAVGTGSIITSSLFTSLSTDQRGVSRTMADRNGNIVQNIGSYESLTRLTITSQTDSGVEPTNEGFNFAQDKQGWATDDVSFRDAVYWADTEALITINAMSWSGAIVHLAKAITISNGITIDGELLGMYQVVLDAGNVDRAFVIDNIDYLPLVEVGLNNMIIQNGNASSSSYSGHGGAIYSKETLVLTNTIVQNSAAAGKGGGIFSQTGDLTLNQSTISANTAGTGGGGIYTEAGNFIAYQSSILSNTTTSGDGGGIYALGSVNFNASTIGMNNAVTGHGGGLYINSATFDMLNSTISNNTAGLNGGGIVFAAGGTYNINYATIANNISGTANEAQHNGGGLYMSAGNLTLTNSVIANNYQYSIDEANRDDFFGFGGTMSSATYNAIGVSTGYVFNVTTDHNITYASDSAFFTKLGLDTQLTDNGGPTLTLYVANTDSILQNHANPASTITVDQRGESRPGVGTSATIGAYQKNISEWVYTGPAAATASDLNDTANWTWVGGTPGAMGTVGAPDQTLYFDPTLGGTDNIVITENWNVSYKAAVVVSNGEDLTVGNGVDEATLTVSLSVLSGGTVVISQSSAFVSANSTNVTVSGTNSKIDVNGTFSGNVNLGSGSILELSTMDSSLINLTVGSLDSSSTVIYNYDGAQTVRTANYGNLTISGTGDKTAFGVITVAGDLSNDSEFVSGYDITVTGDTSGSGNITGSNIYLNGIGNNYSGNITASSGVVNFGGGITSGTITATTLNVNGQVKNVNATTVNSTHDLIVNGIVNTTTLNANMLNLADGATIDAVNASLAMIYSYSGVNTLRVTGAEANVNYSDWNIAAWGTSTLAIDRGSYDINVSDGSVTPSFNITNMTVATNATVKFITTGDVFLTNVVSGSLPNYNGTLWLKGDDITFQGVCNFSSGNMSLVLENSGYFNVDSGSHTTFRNDININNIRITGSNTADTIIESANGSVSLGNVITETSPDVSLAVYANNSITIGGVSGITNVTLDAPVSSTVNGPISISGDFLSNSTDTVVNSNITTSGGDVTILGNLTLTGNISASQDVFATIATTVNGTSSITAGGSMIFGGLISGAGDLTLSAVIAVLGGGADMTGDLTLTTGAFSTAGDITAGNLNVVSPASLAFNNYSLTTGNLTNAGTISGLSTANVSGNVTNSSNNSLTIDTLNLAGSFYNTGTMDVNNLNLVDNTQTSSLSLGGTVADFDTISVVADKEVILTTGNIVTESFAFTGTANSASTFALESGTSLQVTGTLPTSLDYNVLGDYYDGNYFITSGGGKLIQTMTGTDVDYRLGNSDSATIITLSAAAGEKIAVGVLYTVAVDGETVTGIDSTIGFTTIINRNYESGGYTGDIDVTMDWDTVNLQGSNFNQAEAELYIFSGGAWNGDETITLNFDPAPPANRNIVSYTLPHNGTYTIANAGADLTVPPLPMNVNIYEMANAHYIPMYPDLETNIFLNFPVGFYPYYVSDRYLLPSNLQSVGEAAYRQMELRWISNPQTNMLDGQVPAPGVVLGQGITEQASLTLTADAPIYLEVNGEYSVGQGWAPLTEPATVENIEQYQEPVTQGQIDQFYLDFSDREDIFDKPLSFKSDLDEMLDNLLAG